MVATNRAPVIVGIGAVGEPRQGRVDLTELRVIAGLGARLRRAGRRRFARGTLETLPEAEPNRAGIPAQPEGDLPADHQGDELLDLVRGCAAGDRRATTQLVQAVSPRVVRVARRVLGPDHPDVEDAAQESLVAIVRAAGTFEGRSRFLTFASTIAYRTCLAVRKRRKPAHDELDEMPSDDPAPNQTVMAERRRQCLMTLLDQLPDDQRDALTMRIVLGFTLAEVAEAAGAPANTIRSRVRLAKEALRRKIAANPTARELLGVEE